MHIKEFHIRRRRWTSRQYSAKSWSRDSKLEGQQVSNPSPNRNLSTGMEQLHFVLSIPYRP